MRERDDRPILAVVQARMSSTRLPGKSLADLGGEPMLAFLLERLGRSGSLAQIIVATTDEPGDDPIAALAEARQITAHRGPRDDVLARYAGAVADHDGPVVRITGDCPLVDPMVVDELIELYRATPGVRYASNVTPRTYPDGLDAEIVDAATLRELAATDVAATDREHVTTAIRADPCRYPAVTLLRDGESLGTLRWTVDTADDLERVRAVVAVLGPRRHVAALEEIRAAFDALDAGR